MSSFIRFNGWTHKPLMIRTAAIVAVAPYSAAGKAQTEVYVSNGNDSTAFVVSHPFEDAMKMIEQAETGDA